MASFLASFAMGFDIRISNLQTPPVQHPRLVAQTKEFSSMQNSPMYRGIYPHEKDILNVGNPHLNKLYSLDNFQHGQMKRRNRLEIKKKL